MTDHCTLCPRLTAVRVDGRYRNGREATDWRCATHRPEPESVGSWAFFGITNRLFRIETIEPVRR